ncbi:MAG TPA: patatin-like phospholipase family protein [Bacilli bacterium]
MKTNAVFEGGGVKAVALVGAISVAEQRGIQFHQMAGTSSGSIVASMLAAGYTAGEMRKIIEETPFTTFLQRSPLHQIKIIGPALRIFVKKGLYSGDALEHWIRLMLAKKGIRTFADLPPNKLRIIASDITQGKLLVLPDDIAQYDVDPMKFEISKAVRMSSSIPYFFDPVVVKKSFMESTSKGGATPKNIYIVDGALLSNFPLWIFDKEEVLETGNKPIPTIGFRLVGKHSNLPRRIYGPFTMFEALIETMLEAHDERYIEQHNLFRTIKIPTMGVQTTQFNMTSETSALLFNSGEAAAGEFFDNWSDSGYLDKFNKRVMPMVSIRKQR